MQREIITTADGSKTIQIKEWDEQYHSKHGAIQEAYHVFIKHGLNLFQNQSINILEIGFGTGLNAFITFLEAPKLDLNIAYRGVEAYPVSAGELSQLNYISELKAEDFREQFHQMHQSSWEDLVVISDYFKLYKEQSDFREINADNSFAPCARIRMVLKISVIFISSNKVIRIRWPPGSCDCAGRSCPVNLTWIPSMTSRF